MTNNRFLGGVTAYDSQGNERNVFDGQGGGGTSDPSLILCDGTLGQEVAIVNRIQTDIDSGKQNLAYRFSGRLLVSDTPQFENSIMLFNFAGNPTCMVSLDFSDCELVKKDIETNNYTTFIRASDGGILKVESIKLDYTTSGGGLRVFSAYMNSKVFVNNADIKCDCHLDYRVFTCSDSAEIHARDCNINGSAAGDFRAFYIHTGGKALSADNCKINGTSGNNLYAFCIDLMAVNANSYREPQININNCTIDGTAGNTFYAFYVQAGIPFSPTVNVSNCVIKGVAAGEYRLFYVNGSGRDTLKVVFSVTNCTAIVTGEVCSIFYIPSIASNTTLQASNIYIESTATDKSYVFRTPSVKLAKLFCSQVVIREPATGELAMSLGAESKSIVTNCIFPSRSIEGMPQEDSATGSQIWCNNIYEE